MKNNLAGFVEDLVDQQQEDYDDVYNFIISYESIVMADTVLEEDEKDTILKISSVSRYSLYEEARRRDRDWEKSVTTKNSRPPLIDTDSTLITLAILFDRMH